MSAFNARHDAVTALYTVPTLKKLLKSQPTIAVPIGSPLAAAPVPHPADRPRTDGSWSSPAKQP
ncbi:hypothetical protein B9479_008390, partial [Cryptococcus floricola]